ncbi:MAG: hypothetical protein K0S47_3300 [Herbinix sp.]|jgi:hypothetical protein|nr:hypothetical protein [Herbinix sp.]
MNDKKSNNLTPPLNPYDSTMEDNWTMYDTMPYVKDDALIRDSGMKKESGNIIKSYRCILIEPYEIKN